MTKPPSPRPLSIKLLAVFFYTLPNIFWFIADVLPLSVQKVLRFPGWVQSAPDWSTLYFSGLVVFGHFSVLIRLTYVIVPIVIGLGIWQLRESYRRFAIGWQVFIFVNDLLVLVSPFTRSYFVSAAIRQGSEPLWARQWCLLSFSSDVVVSLILLAIVLLVLITRKAAFGKPRTAT